MNRFNKKQTWLGSFTNEILVVCPACDHCAKVIKVDVTKYYSRRRLLCQNCGHTQNDKKDTYTVSVKRNCPQCGNPFHKIIKAMVDPKPILKIACPHCSFSESYKTNVMLDLPSSRPSYPTDDYYGQPLWLVGEFKGQDVWAFNREHLALMIRYVSADLREKYSHLGSAKSMEKKLPKWMKLAKNRNSLIKVLENLQRK